MIQKIKLDFTHLVNLGPIIVDITKLNKIDVPVGTEIATSSLQSQHFIHKYYLSSPLSDIPFCTFLPTFMSHRATQISYQHFHNCKTFLRPMCIHFFQVASLDNRTRSPIIKST